MMDTIFHPHTEGQPAHKKLPARKKKAAKKKAPPAAKPPNKYEKLASAIGDMAKNAGPAKKPPADDKV